MNWQIHRFVQLESTQSWLCEQAGDLPEGSCALALQQTAGFGRQGRSWHSETGGLYASLLLKPERLLPELPWALWWALLQGIEQQTGLELVLKAPNDLLLNQRKLAGLLVDAKIMQARPLYYVCGFGINLNQTRFAEPVSEQAISLLQATGRQWLPEVMLQAVLQRFETIYQLLLSEDFAREILRALGGRQVRIGYNGPESVAFEEYWHGGGIGFTGADDSTPE